MEMKCENERFAPVTFVIKILIFLRAAESISGKIFALKTRNFRFSKAIVANGRLKNKESVSFSRLEVLLSPYTLLFPNIVQNMLLRRSINSFLSVSQWFATMRTDEPSASFDRRSLHSNREAQRGSARLA